MRTVAIVQARMGSSRLPGKAMMDLGGMPIVAWVLRAAKAARQLDAVWFAIPHHDLVLAEWCHKQGVPFTCGPENDVLGRYALAARESRATFIVRLTADCPLLDPQVIDNVITTANNEAVSFADNRPGYPDGLDVEAFTRFALMKADREVDDPYCREHIGQAIKKVSRSSAALICNDKWPDVKFSIDTGADLDYVRGLLPSLPSNRPPKWMETLDAVRKVKAAA